MNKWEKLRQWSRGLDFRDLGDAANHWADDEVETLPETIGEFKAALAIAFAAGQQWERIKERTAVEVIMNPPVFKEVKVEKTYEEKRDILYPGEFPQNINDIKPESCGHCESEGLVNLPKIRTWIEGGSLTGRTWFYCCENHARKILLGKVKFISSGEWVDA